MGGIGKFERKLEQAVSSVFARAFRSAVQPVEIASALQREVDNNTQILSRDRRLVPNDFTVELSPTDLERLTPYDSSISGELGQQLKKHADQQGYVFPGPVTIDFEPAEDLTTGRFRIRSSAKAKVTPSPSAATPRRALVWLEINGQRHPVTPPGIVVGRGSDADLRINDPGISRRHVQFAVVPARDEVYADAPGVDIGVRDLGSTNGILVDGHRVASARLRDGSQVRIGNTTVTVRVSEAGDDV